MFAPSCFRGSTDPDVSRAAPRARTRSRRDPAPTPRQDPRESGALFAPNVAANPSRLTGRWDGGRCSAGLATQSHRDIRATPSSFLPPGPTDVRVKWLATSTRAARARRARAAPRARSRRSRASCGRAEASARRSGAFNTGGDPLGGSSAEPEGRVAQERRRGQGGDGRSTSRSVPPARVNRSTSASGSPARWRCSPGTTPSRARQQAWRAAAAARPRGTGRTPSRRRRRGTPRRTLPGAGPRPSPRRAIAASSRFARGPGRFECCTRKASRSGAASRTSRVLTPTGCREASAASAPRRGS